MIIKSIFRRYERWNPVHPTYGAFWGVGVGIGCGVGWGPGFGPDVIGYVGAGCGVGFSVGITLLGFGIGAPANYLLQVPHSALMVTGRGALDVVRAGGLLGKRESASFSIFKIENWKGKNMMDDFPGMKGTLISNAKQITDCLQRVKGRFCRWDRGSKT